MSADSGSSKMFKALRSYHLGHRIPSALNSRLLKASLSSNDSFSQLVPDCCTLGRTFQHWNPPSPWKRLRHVYYAWTLSQPLSVFLEWSHLFKEASSFCKELNHWESTTSSGTPSRNPAWLSWAQHFLRLMVSSPLWLRNVTKQWVSLLVS